MERRRHTTETVFMLLVLVAALAVALGASGNHLEAHPWGAIAAADADFDHDGIPDLFDLCPGEDNVGLPDRDGDGVRDDCDLSPDGDGTLHIVFEDRDFIGRPESALTLAAR